LVVFFLADPELIHIVSNRIEMVSAAGTGAALAMLQPRAAALRRASRPFAAWLLQRFNRAFTDSDPRPTDVQTVMTLGVFSHLLLAQYKIGADFIIGAYNGPAIAPAACRLPSSRISRSKLFFGHPQTPQNLILSFWET
jgi:hypothetical protein